MRLPRSSLLRVAGRRALLLVILLIPLAMPPSAALGRRTVDSPARILPSVAHHTADRTSSQSNAHVASAVREYVLADFTFDFYAQPDAQGWIAREGFWRPFAGDTFFHVANAAELSGGVSGNMVVLEGSQSLWCGASIVTRPDLCQWATPPGYGNAWDQLFTSTAFSHAGEVTLSYKIFWDSEPAEDPTFVYYLDKNGEWVEIQDVDNGAGRYWGTGSATETLTVPASELGESVRFRFRFFSDGAWSDFDGLWPTDGALILDSLAVSDTTGVIDYQDFESELPGALRTSDGHWAATRGQTLGSFGGLFPGMDVLQEDDCIVNSLSGLWGFFDGSPDTYACGGHPEQAAVPLARQAGPYEYLYLSNEIWSPPIAWNTDLNGTPVPATAEHAVLEFDVYRDLPFENLVFYAWGVRGIVSGCATAWNTNNLVYWGGRKDWFLHGVQIGAYVPQGATQIQVRLQALDLCGYWCAIFPHTVCHSHAPLFDNVRVTRRDTQGPTWSVEDAHLFQDNFAEDGTTTGTVRLDMPMKWPDGSPHDSVRVRVQSAFGLDSHVPGDPASGPAVYIHVKDVSPAKSGSAISGSPLVRWPVVATSGGWTVLRLDHCFNQYGSLIAHEYCVDLRDNLFEPGDTIFYYFSARDTNGVTTYWSREAGATRNSPEVLAAPMEVTCLPANALAGATDVLYIDDFDGFGARPLFESAFAALGIQPDRYDVLAPSSLVENGPGDRVKNVGQQLIGPYRKIIWNSGYLGSWTILDGAQGVNAADDFAMLFAFLDQHPEGAGLYISGDQVASEWIGLGSTSALALRTYMNFLVSSDNHVEAGHGVSPLVIAEDGSCFDHPLGPDTLVAFGGCSPASGFDVLQATGASSVEMAYSGTFGEAALLGQVTANAAGDTARVVLSGFSWHWIHDDRVQSPVDRVDHLRDILRWLDNDVPAPTGTRGRPTETNYLAQNYPNPFNPSTTIRFGTRKAGRASLRIYTVTGALVAILIDAGVDAGEHVVRWDGNDASGNEVPTGVYYYRLRTHESVQTNKMVLLR